MVVINVHTGGRQKPGGNYGAGLFYITLGSVTIGEVHVPYAWY